MCKHYTASFNAQVVLDLLKDEKSIGEIAPEYGVHPTMLHRWKKMAVGKISSLFDDKGKNSAAALKKEHEKETTQLSSKIGKLTTQLQWIKKAGIESDS